ncbi:hypothetical protein [Proteiniphilum sp. X52]|uniref:hypothetical protein n=1 Tax=Proteiniphilum sp. X52 TaxID=2382159 RepID=UPI000F0A456E|nr:hypothetical protein [Proteiniphilum sp. X52]RNC65308.1 hypothetical protein D7D25_07355 [Proteiniphilum sp. X52]
MKIFRIFRVAILFIVLFNFPSSLFAQEDVSVEFSFNKPGEYVCEIRNMTDSWMTIWLNKEEADIRSNLYFYALNSINDTVPIYYELWKDPKKLILHLDAGETYTNSYKFIHPERYVKARVVIKYVVKSLPRKGGSYERIFNLREVRNKAYIPQVLREDEE